MAGVRCYTPVDAAESLVGLDRSVRLRVISDERGLIAWRWGTGGNTELTHLRAVSPRGGNGRSLLIDMLKALKDDPPYATVFGFTRTSNKDAHAYYTAMGFTLSPVVGVYADGEAVVFSAVYSDLCKLHGV